MSSGGDGGMWHSLGVLKRDLDKLNVFGEVTKEAWNDVSGKTAKRNAQKKAEEAIQEQGRLREQDRLAELVKKQQLDISASQTAKTLQDENIVSERYSGAGNTSISPNRDLLGL